MNLTVGAALNNRLSSNHLNDLPAMERQFCNPMLSQSHYFHASCHVRLGRSRFCDGVFLLTHEHFGLIAFVASTNSVANACSCYVVRENRTRLTSNAMPKRQEGPKSEHSFRPVQTDWSMFSEVVSGPNTQTSTVINAALSPPSNCDNTVPRPTSGMAVHVPRRAFLARLSPTSFEAQATNDVDLEIQSPPRQNQRQQF